MARYVLLLNWTEQGVKNVKDTVGRAKAAADAAQKIGARLHHCYWTLGQYDLALIVEAPNDETITALALQLGNLGNVKSTTMRAFDEAEMRGILQKL